MNVDHGPSKTGVEGTWPGRSGSAQSLAAALAVVVDLRGMFKIEVIVNCLQIGA